MYQKPWSNGTTGPAVRWPAGKPHVLVEDPSELATLSDHTLLREAGFDVAVCTGPDGSAGCPLVAEGRCELAEGADVVLFGLGLDDPAGRDVLRAHLRQHPDRPVVILPRRSRSGAAADLTGCASDAPCTVLHPATSVGGQVHALRKALCNRGAPPP